MPKDFLVCIDSDGCAFDTMEIKHKECFCPAYINFFGLQPVSKYARDAWDFANLYSAFRGVNRFPVLLKALDVLRDRKEVLERGFVTPTLPSLRAYIAAGKPLNNAGIEAYLEEKRKREAGIIKDISRKDATVAVSKEKGQNPTLEDVFDKKTYYNPGKIKSRLLKQLEKYEKQLAESEERANELKLQLMDPALGTDYEKLMALQEKLEAEEHEQETLLERMMETETELEELE